MGEFRMPSLGADMEAGTLVEWLVEPGQAVERGDIVAVVETEKSTIEVEIFEAGVIDALLVEPGTKVPVGAPLATVRHEEVGQRAPEPAITTPGGAEAVSSPAEAVSSPLVRRLAQAGGVDLASVHGTGRGGLITRADVEAQLPKVTPRTAARVPDGDRPRVSPYARRMARRLGVDASTLRGSGSGGAVVAADVERVANGMSAPAAPEAAPTASDATSASVSGSESAKPDDRKAAMRRAIGSLMARSKREIPHYYLGTYVDMSRALEWLARENEQRPMPSRILPAVLLLKAAARAARDVPELNGFWTDDAFQPAAAVHLGVAVSLRGGGLIAPAIHDADTKTLDEMMADLRDVVGRARAGRLRSSEMSDPTITVTNLGEQGVETVYGVIYAPQVALVGFGKIVERPWAEDGMVGARRVVHATLAADHRVTDGHRGGTFLAAVDRHLQQPEEL
jgi:pyruvate dehydrogenase E2 component (dihydrolipoamide acetyltransferase)